MMTQTSTEFLLESSLAAKSPALSENFKSIAFAMSSIMNKTEAIFPKFTDHTIGHSLIVLEMANQIIGPEQMEKLNEDEIYILMCAAYMHDFGMTISVKDFNELKEGIVPDRLIAESRDQHMTDLVRMYHNYFSEKLIYKYAGLFDFPSEEYTYCIAKVSKGHRKNDLYNKEEYNPAYRLPNGNPVRLPYLSAIIRLCDEMDITIERNSAASYLEHADVLNFLQHFAVKQLIIEKDRFIVQVETEDPKVREACMQVINKLNDTLQYCIDVTTSRTDFEITQNFIEVLMNGSPLK